MTSEQLLLAATLSGAFVAGLVLAMPSSLIGPLAQHLGTSEGRTRLLGTIFQFLLVPMMVGSGLLIDKWGPQTVLIVGMLLTAFAIASVEFTRFYRHVLPVFVVLAAAAAAITIACIVLMPMAIMPHRV